MAYHYTILGSEDGIIAVASSPAKAVAIAAAYVTQTGGQAKYNASHNLDRAVNDLRKHKCYYIEIDNLPLDCVASSGFTAQAQITKYDTNWYHKQW